MNSEFVKSFTAGVDIEAHLPVIMQDGKVVPATSASQLAKGVTTHKALEGEAVDVLMFGEGLVRTTGAVTGTKMLIASEDSSAIELNFPSDTSVTGLVCTFANPIETASASAILNCFVCPQLIHLPAAE